MIISSKTDEFQVGCVINLSATKPYNVHCERMDSSAKLPPAHMRYVACHLSSQYNIKKTKVSSFKKFDFL